MFQIAQGVLLVRRQILPLEFEPVEGEVLAVRHRILQIGLGQIEDQVAGQRLENRYEIAACCPQCKARCSVELHAAWRSVNASRGCAC